MNENMKDDGSVDLLRHIAAQQKRMLHMKVDELMRREVVAVQGSDLCAKAARLLIENGYFGLPVLDREEAVGMVTVFDLLRLGYEESFDADRKYLRLTVIETIAEKPFYSIESGATLVDAVNFMMQRRLRTLPVLKERRLDGILSVIDLVQWYRTTHQEILRGGE